MAHLRESFKDEIAKTFSKALFWPSTFCSSAKHPPTNSDLLWKRFMKMLLWYIQTFCFLQTSFKCHQKFSSRHQPVLPSRKHSSFWLASVFGKLSIKHQWNLGSQCSPETLDGCVREKQPKVKLVGRRLHTYTKFPKLPNSRSSNNFYYLPQEQCKVGKLWNAQAEPQPPALALLLKSCCHMWQKTAKGWLSPTGHWSESMMTVCIAQQIK